MTTQKKEMMLEELREARGFARGSIKTKIGRHSAEKIEKRSAMSIHELQAYVSAIGGKLEIFANFPDATVRIKNFDTKAVYLRPITGGVLWADDGSVSYDYERAAGGRNPLKFSKELCELLNKIEILYETYNPAWAADPMNVDMTTWKKPTSEEKDRMKSLITKAADMIRNEIPKNYRLEIEYPEEFE